MRCNVNTCLWKYNICRQIFSAWCNGFISRIENDSKSQRSNIFISVYLHELWSLVVHYQEYIQQFYEASRKIGIHQETVDQYNRFMGVFSPFMQKYWGYIGNLKTATEVPKHDENRGYITGRKIN